MQSALIPRFSLLSWSTIYSEGWSDQLALHRRHRPSTLIKRKEKNYWDRVSDMWHYISGTSSLKLSFYLRNQEKFISKDFCTKCFWTSMDGFSGNTWWPCQLNVRRVHTSIAFEPAPKQQEVFYIVGAQLLHRDWALHSFLWRQRVFIYQHFNIISSYVFLIFLVDFVCMFSDPYSISAF